MFVSWKFVYMLASLSLYMWKCAHLSKVFTTTIAPAVRRKKAEWKKHTHTNTHLLNDKKISDDNNNNDNNNTANIPSDYVYVPSINNDGNEQKKGLWSTLSPEVSYYNVWVYSFALSHGGRPQNEVLKHTHTHTLTLTHNENIINFPSWQTFTNNIDDDKNDNSRENNSSSYSISIANRQLCLIAMRFFKDK